MMNLNPPVRFVFLRKPSLENATNASCNFWDFLADGKPFKVLNIFEKIVKIDLQCHFTQLKADPIQGLIQGFGVGVAVV